jgi:hypothetical protein
MLYRPSFRKTAVALTTGAILAATAAFPLAAQQASQVNFRGIPDCATVHDGGKRAACEFFKKVDDAKKRGAAADDAIGCLKDLGKFKEKNPDGFAKLGVITRDNACSMASKLRPTASLN